ncbi:MAG: alpha/beta hydrolase [Saprospiraceae bacterium]|nr:alpha/beta hydrolase [Saprospiraceae bacterium]
MSIFKIFLLFPIFCFVLFNTYDGKLLVKKINNVSPQDTHKFKKPYIDSNARKEFFISDLIIPQYSKNNTRINSHDPYAYPKKKGTGVKKKEAPPKFPLPEIDTNQYNDFYLVPVYYATDRSKKENTLESYYGNSRSTKDVLDYGLMHVSIPKSHRRGNLELPNMLRVKSKYEPDKFVLIRSIETFQEDNYMLSLSSTLKNSSNKDIFIFIHGFNSTFSEGAKRTAQLYYDLGFKGLALYYSWSSNGSATDYIKDGTNAEYSYYAFKNYVQTIIKNLKPTKIHMVAHSMGNRVLTLALKSIAEENSKIKFNQVILAAPDIDAAIFERDIAPKIKNLATRYTIYTAKDDRALNASEILNGYIRLGKVNKSIAGFYTVDASNVIKGDLFNHNYFVSSTNVIDDIRALFERNEPPEKRNLVKNGDFWAIKG